MVRMAIVIIARLLALTFALFCNGVVVVDVCAFLMTEEFVRI